MLFSGSAVADGEAGTIDLLRSKVSQRRMDQALELGHAKTVITAFAHIVGGNHHASANAESKYRGHHARKWCAVVYVDSA